MMSEEGANVNPFGGGGTLQLELTDPKSPESPASPSPEGRREGSGEVGVVSGAPAVLCMRGGGGSLPVAELGSRLESLKSWSLSTYKTTRQALEERLGKTSRTVDVEVEAEVEGLRKLKREYEELLVEARALAGHFSASVASQAKLSDVFRRLSVSEASLREEFQRNAETQRILAANGEALSRALNAFVSGLATLTEKSIEDTLATVRTWELARLEYDAYRGDLAGLQGGGGSREAFLEAEANCAEHKRRYEGLREDVKVKMKFLEEHRSKAVAKHLLLFHNAVAAYYSGNAQGLQAALKQFSLPNSLPSPNDQPPSFLQS